MYNLWRKVRHREEIQAVGRNLNRHIAELFRDPMPVRIERGFSLTGGLVARIKTVAADGGARLAIVMLPLIVQMTDKRFTDFVRAAESRPNEVRMDKPQREVRADRKSVV